MCFWHLSAVRFLRKTLLVLTALLWLPVSSHCQLEVIPGLEFLSCCSHAGKTPHQDNDCKTDGCENVESGFYKTEDRSPDASHPVSVVMPAILVALLWDASLPIPAGSNLDVSQPPPELSKVWQFASRAALPVRAPSIAS
jgi:hypothetical protein